MRMRERSSVERMRIALTEKRDMLGGMVAVCRTSFGEFRRCVQSNYQLLYSMKLGMSNSQIKLRLGGI